MDKYMLMAEYDYYAIYKDSDMINYLAHLYKEMDKAGIFSGEYLEELFDEGDTDTASDNAE